MVVSQLPLNQIGATASNVRKIRYVIGSLCRRRAARTERAREAG
jgi:hypothetical protein